MQSINGKIRVFCKNPLARSLWARNSCSKLFVGGLSYDTNETVLKNAFEKHGEIIDVRVIAHHVTGKSRGYGFVRSPVKLQPWLLWKICIPRYWMVEIFELNSHVKDD